MENSRESTGKRLLDKLYGGLNMNWLAVVLLAVGTAVLTAVFLIIPVFKNTSFERMGVTLEAWVFFAVIIMANCKKPLESALKTFVFFLLSQPLIYLIQVPFSALGWGLFRFYRTWFIWTLLTFPAAFVGWYIKKKNWLSLLILLPVLFLLTSTYIEGFQSALRHFPRLLFTAVFCLLQVLLYLLAFTENVWQKLAGLLLPLAAALILLLARPQVNINGAVFLPGDPVLSENAVVSMAEDSPIGVTIEHTGEDSMIRIRTAQYGTAAFVIRDGETEYRYTVEIYEDEGGHSQIRVTPAE